MNVDSIITSVETFFKKMLSDDSGVSSKRVVGFGSFILVAGCVIVNLCGGTVVAQFIFLGLIGLIAACFGLNTMISMKQLGVRSDVASDVVKSDASISSNAIATDILQSDKP